MNECNKSITKQTAMIQLCSVLFFILLHFSGAKNPNARIIGGDVAKAAQFPYAAAIYASSLEERIFCGGTLISAEWILTAGQCVDGKNLFNVYLGSTLLNGADDNRLVLSSSQSVLHPLYDPTTLQNDIGLIQLRLPISFSIYLKPVDQLPNVEINDGTQLTTCGWGTTNDTTSELSNELKYVRVTAIPNRECERVYGSAVSNETVCVEGNYNEGTCNGDTGGPLLQEMGRGVMMVVGVASFLSGNGCESTDPSGYTRVVSYTPWIKNITNIP